MSFFTSNTPYTLRDCSVLRGYQYSPSCFQHCQQVRRSCRRLLIEKRDDGRTTTYTSQFLAACDRKVAVLSTGFLMPLLQEKSCSKSQPLLPITNLLLTNLAPNEARYPKLI